MAADNKSNRQEIKRDPFTSAQWTKARPVIPEASQHIPRSEQVTTDPLDRLLRREMAAFQTYKQAIEEFRDDPRVGELRRIAEEHRHSVVTLGQHISERRGKPSSTPGLWGIWAKAVEGTAKIFGKAAALKALKKGEMHGVKEYENTLIGRDLGPESFTLINDQLLPQTREHIELLDQLSET